MKRRQITDGSCFIVFDMEWNQAIPGKHYDIDVASLSGEIIEIGAVKYIYRDGRLHYEDVFSCDIRPHYYKKLHYHVKRVTGKTNADLQNGVYLESGYRAFREFCGKDAILAGWGTSDPDMLKKNLKIRRMNDQLGIDFVDIQPLFSAFTGDKGHQRSVEFAVDYYGIAKSETFHSATADARYTGEILCCILNNNDTEEVLDTISKAIVNPDVKRDYSFVSPVGQNGEAAVDYVNEFIVKCPRCGLPLKMIYEPFRIRKSIYALGECAEDGEFYARARIKKGKEGGIYTAALMRLASPMDIWMIKEKKCEFDEFGVNGKPVTRPEDDNKDMSDDDKSVNVNGKNE